MEVESQFPSNQKNKRSEDQRIRVIGWDKDQGSKHHGVIPIVDSAGSAAFIFQNKGLEGTEKQNTDHITNRIDESDNEKYSTVEDSCKIQTAEEKVQCTPGKKCIARTPRLCYCGIANISGRDEGFRKLFLTSHAFDTGREKAEDHFYNINDPDQSENKIANRDRDRYRTGRKP